MNSPYITVKNKNLVMFHIKLCQEISSINNQINANELNLNINKIQSKYSRRHLVDNPAFIYADNKIIHWTPSTKFLGIRVDEYMNWKQHISNTDTSL